MNNKFIKAITLSIACLVAVFPSQSWAAASAYKTEYRYNLARQVTGVITPDPDGAGTLHYLATRNTYNAQGLVSIIESGELADWPAQSTLPNNWVSYTVSTSQHFTYDAWGRKLTTISKEGSNGTIKQVKQYKYDSLGRVQCEMIRMATTTTTDACAATSNADGYDRITKYSYDSHNDITKIQKAYSTPIQQDYATYTYVAAGLKEGITDANGNYNELAYDDFGRLETWYFPSKTNIGIHNTADFEKYVYDNNGNLKELHKRSDDDIDNTEIIKYDYDALNQMTKKDLAGTSQDVYYSYDLRGLSLTVQFDTTANNLGDTGISNVFDGFGRQKSSTTTMGGSSRKLTYQYDNNSNRTHITHPDGKVFVYHYDGLNRLDELFENTTTSVLTQVYNNKGLRSDINRGLSTSNNTHYGYDGVNRLNVLSHTLLTKSLTEFAFTYNPASQVKTKTLSNPAFNYVGDENLIGAYAVNGLNQYTGVGGVTFSHDTKGNLTSDGFTTYSYDTENRLLTATGTDTTTLKYDPLGRMYQMISSDSTTNFLYDGDALVAEYNASGSITKRYVHGSGIDEPLVIYSGATVASANHQYLHSDYQGSIVALSDGDNVMTAINTYDVYGIAHGDNIGRFAYTGQLALPELGMYYYKARIYHPKLGRFLQNDPVGYEDQMNLYAYVGNDPVNNTDPTGKVCVPCVAGIAGGIIGGAAEYINNPDASFSSVGRAMVVGAGVGVASSLGGGLGTTMLAGGTANATGEMINQIATGERDGLKVLVAGATGLVGGAVAKGVASKVVPKRGYGHVNKTSANHNSAPGRTPRTMEGGSSEIVDAPKRAMSEVTQGAAYGAGAVGGAKGAEKMTCIGSRIKRSSC